MRSEILPIIFPAIRLSDGSVQKILSKSVFDLGLIHLGEVIWGMEELENMSKKFVKSLFPSLFSKSILMWPNSSMSSFVSFNHFILNSDRKHSLNLLSCMLGCLQMQPIITLLFLGMIISINTDSSSRLLYMTRSFLTLQIKLFFYVQQCPTIPAFCGTVFYVITLTRGTYKTFLFVVQPGFCYAKYVCITQS